MNQSMVKRNIKFDAPFFLQSWSMLFQIPIEKHSDLSFTFFKKTPQKIYFLQIFKGPFFFALPQESEFWLVLRAAKLQFLKNVV